MHTNPRAVLANSDRLTPEDMRLDQESRLVWLAITDDRNIMRRVTAGPLRWVIYRLRRENNRSCPLELIARIVVWLANAGVSEARLRMIPVFITRVIEECFAGKTHRSLDELDREEQRFEARENELTIERRVVGVAQCAPDHLEAEALANESEAAVQLERARVLRRLARQGKTRVLQFPASPSIQPS